MKQYQFKCGEENPRIYEGSLISPLDGMRLGARVAKILSGALSNADLDSGLLDTFSDNSKLMKFIIQCLPQIDTDELYAIFLDAAGKASLFAALENERAKKASLNSESGINKWFEDYREDLFMVAANVIARNCAPFLPKEFQGLISKAD